MPNPIWVSIIASTMRKHSRKCPHCSRTGVYPAIEPGRYYTCRHCGRRFMEKKKEEDKRKT